jgi:hypothetical protein
VGSALDRREPVRDHERRPAGKEAMLPALDHGSQIVAIGSAVTLSASLKA